MSRPDRHASIKINKIHVVCKCPKCHVLHVETQGWRYKPAVTPWRYCKQHAHQRGECET